MKLYRILIVDDFNKNNNNFNDRQCLKDIHPFVRQCEKNKID